MRRFVPRHRPLARLARDRRGATIVEFAMVAPAMCLFLVGAFDISHTLYAQAVLQGAVQKAARDATLEEGSTADQQKLLDDRVRAQAGRLANTAEITFTRRFYRSFSEVAAARAEAFTDTNSNGICDAGEPYQDDNNNGHWDADGGNAGQGGAKDAVLYTAKMTYPHLLPIYRFIGGSDTVTIVASTVLKNQPYADQGNYEPPTVRNCP